MVGATDVFNLSSRSCFCALVPLFHANSWGLVFAAPMAGARLVLPGASQIILHKKGSLECVLAHTCKGSLVHPARVVLSICILSTHTLLYLIAACPRKLSDARQSFLDLAVVMTYVSDGGTHCSNGSDVN